MGLGVDNQRWNKNGITMEICVLSSFGEKGILQKDRRHTGGCRRFRTTCEIISKSKGNWR